MQIFLPYKEPYKVAEVLDKRRLNKQIIEADRIYKTLTGNPVSRSLPKHPIVLMYKGHEDFVKLYRDTLKAYKGNYFEEAKILSKEALKYLPEFITQEYLDYFKGRLYTKDNSLYFQFKIPYKVEYSMYFIDGEWRYYLKGKLIKKI